MKKHFSRIAKDYRDLRDTDLEPVLYLKNNMALRDPTFCVDIGCGTGRYIEKMMQNLGGDISFYCVDNNPAMLKILNKTLGSYDKLHVVRADATHLPIESNSVDYVFAFNSIHHFPINPFLREARRILKRDGYLFIYTRTRMQNEENIWGRLFPHFTEKETRLYGLPEIYEILTGYDNFLLEDMKTFSYTRISKPSELINQARHKHYSTFALYERKEFQEALEIFEDRLSIFGNKSLKWKNKNTMFKLRKIR